jgi:hypothetical protein
MPFTPDTAKPALLAEVATIEKHQALWTLIGALVGATAGLVVAPIAVGVAGPAAVCLYVLQLNKIDTNRILNDPPRVDYAVPVRARRRRFVPGHMQSPIESATAQFVERVLDRLAYLEAAVRADERAQHALSIGDDAHFQQRLLEGQRAADRAASAAERLSRAADELASTWSYSAALDAALGDAAMRADVTRGMRGEVDAVRVFPSEALTYVARTRLVTAGLRPIVRVTARDAEAMVSNPYEAIRVRSGAYGSATVRASRTLREGYGKESPDEPREQRPDPGDDH